MVNFPVLASALLAGIMALMPIQMLHAGNAARSVLGAIDAVDEHGVVHLRSGDQFCLSGLWFPSVSGRYQGTATWREAIIDHLSEARIEMSTMSDRYGCRLLASNNQEGPGLHEDLISSGLAIVDPSSALADQEAIGALLALEDVARSKRRGIWRDRSLHPKDADDLADWIGTRQLVEGRVRRVSETDRYLYLNFGADWRTDFTVRIRRSLADEQDLDHKSMDGKRLRVRGVLQDSRGPLIDIANLKQIEFLP